MSLSIYHWHVSISVDDGMIKPGTYGQVRITLLRPKLFQNGQTFEIREQRLGRTTASGIIIERQPAIHLPDNKLSKVEINV